MMPNFLVIGAARSGTTSLHHYLRSHPEIYMSPVKEPNFFAHDGMRFDLGPPAPGWKLSARHSVIDPRKYRALFDGVKGEKAIGEVSPAYMRSPGAAERIHRAIPEARLVAILRDPAERAYANYMGRLRDGTERDPDPGDAIRGALSGPGWRTAVYIDLGFYHARLRPFYERFDREQIRVVLFDDFVPDPAIVLREIFSFLAVDPGFTPDTSVAYNWSGRIVNPPLRFAWGHTREIRARLGPRLPSSIPIAVGKIVRRNISRPPMSPDLRAELVERYRPDVLELEKLIERDLSAWLT